MIQLEEIKMARDVSVAEESDTAGFATEEPTESSDANRAAGSGGGGGGSLTSSGEAVLRTRLREVERYCARQTETCLEMETDVHELYRQRLAECHADRVSRRPADRPTGGCESATVPPTLSNEVAAYIAASPAPLQPFLIPPGAPRQCRHAIAASEAAHSCAVTLTLRLAFTDWLWRRVEQAEPPGSFIPSEAIFGTSAAALEYKLDAVRFCAAAANLGTRG